MDGTTIPTGTPVLAAYSAAGRDTAAHGPDADRFDITRETNRHISFGHGPHFCLGSPLARLEATIALEQLFTRFPDLDLTLPDAQLPGTPASSETAYRNCAPGCAARSADGARRVTGSAVTEGSRG